MDSEEIGRYWTVYLPPIYQELLILVKCLGLKTSIRYTHCFRQIFLSEKFFLDIGLSILRICFQNCFIVYKHSR